MFKWWSGFVKKSANQKSETPSEEQQIEPKPGWVYGKTISDYQQKFITGPIGKWSHAAGTFSGVMNELWQFNADYTGNVLDIGPFGGPNDEILFEWKKLADFTIACRVIKWPDYPESSGYPDDSGYDDEEDNDEDEWKIIKYNFRTIETDCGEIIAMVEISETGAYKEGFWLSMEPLSYNSC